MAYGVRYMTYSQLAAEASQLWGYYQYLNNEINRTNRGFYSRAYNPAYCTKYVNQCMKEQVRVQRRYNLIQREMMRRNRRGMGW